MVLNHARKEKIEITVYLSNGVPLKGRVISFDNFTIVLEQGGKQYLVYKHAITTVIPAKKINLSAVAESAATESAVTEDEPPPS